MIDYTEPRNQAEWTTAIMQNIRYIGRGASTATIFPCPFCAHPDLYKMRIMHTQADMNTVNTCKNCGRTSTNMFTIKDGGVSVEVVQLAGDEPQDFLKATETGPPRWFLGCPVLVLEDKVTRAQVDYMHVPNYSFEQVVCMRAFNHPGGHVLVPIESGEGQIARSNFRDAA